MHKLGFGIFHAIFLSVISLSAQQTGGKDSSPPPAAKPKQEFKIPPEDSKRGNPVKPDAASLAAGKQLYSSQCVMCHGKDGSGTGDLVEPMHLTMKDYRKSESLKNFTDGDLFYILNKGKGDMPGQEGRMQDHQLWNLVNYIRSLAKKDTPVTEKKPEAPKPLL